MNEYIIVNKTQIQKRIDELEKYYNEKANINDDHWCSIIAGQITGLKEILSQSTPLISEIEKSWEHGYTRGYNLAYCEGTNSECLTPDKQDYISNLKLDI